MCLDQALNDGLVGLAHVPEVLRHLPLLLGLGKQGLEGHHGRVAAFPELSVDIEHVGDSARHAGGEVAPGNAQHDHRATGHVFAAVIAHAFNHRLRAGVAHREALTTDTAEIGFAGNGAVEHHVAGNNVLGGFTAELGRRLHADATA